MEVLLLSHQISCVEEVLVEVVEHSPRLSSIHYLLNESILFIIEFVFRSNFDVLMIIGPQKHCEKKRTLQCRRSPENFTRLELDFEQSICVTIFNMHSHIPL